MSQTFDRRDHTTASCSRLRRSSLHSNQPSLRRSECTTIPVTSSGPSGPGWPSIRTYRKPCVVNRGSNTSPSPAETTSSTWPSGSGSGTMGRSTSRCVVVRSPSPSSHSPCDKVSCRPGPSRASRTHPLKFCPKSTTKASPPRTGRTATGRIWSTRRTGGATERTTATSTSRATARFHDRSSNAVSSMAGSRTAGSRSRRSSRWPPDGVAPLALAQVRPHLDLRLGRAPGAVEDGQPDERLGPAVHPARVEAVVGAQPVGALHRGPFRQPPAQRRIVPAAKRVPADDLGPHLRGSGSGMSGHQAAPSPRGRSGASQATGWWMSLSSPSTLGPESPPAPRTAGCRF